MAGAAHAIGLVLVPGIRLACVTTVDVAVATLAVVAVHGLFLVAIVAMAIAIAMLRESRVGRTAGKHQRGGQGKNGLVHEDVLFDGDNTIATDHDERTRLISAYPPRPNANHNARHRPL